MRSLWFSPTLRSVMIYGVSGLGFAGANLILARVLPTAQYGLFTLVIALMNLSFAVAPIGVDGIVNRRRLDAGPILLKRTLLAGLVTALLAITIAGFLYRIDTFLLLMVFAATVGGGAMAVAAAQFQSEQRYGISLALTQSPNIVLIIAALAVVWTGLKEARLPVSIAAIGFVLAGIVGWWVLFGERAGKPQGESRFPWGEALSFAGVNAAGLRAASTVAERRRLIAHEVKLVSVIILAGSIAIWFLTPWIERSFLAGKYHLTGSLLLATLFSGVAKIMNSVTKSTVSALATSSELWILNSLGWVSVAVALIAGIIGARWGLAGLIYGVGLGWLMRALTGSYLTLRHLKLPETIPATAP